MIIGIDASRANRKHKSGTEWYSYHLIKKLAKLDKKNQYILYTDKPLTGGLLDLTKEDRLESDNDDKPVFDKKGYQIIKSPHNNFKANILNWPFFHFWTLGRLTLEMIINRPDVLFIPAHGLPLVRPRATINTVHDVAFKIDNYIYQKEQLGAEKIFFKKIINILVRTLTKGRYGANSFDYLDWSTRFSVKHSDKILTVSDFTKNELIRIYGISSDRVEVVYNGFDHRLYKIINDQDKTDEVLSRYGISKPFILNVGRLEKKKNTSLLIEAFAKARHFNKGIKEKLVLVGDASYGYDEVKYMIEEFSLDDDVIMPGWVEEEDMPYIFSAATAFVFPSRHEGFGIPIVQSMACGVPVACSDIPALKEIADDAALFFSIKEKDLVARAIEKIITDNNLRKDLIAKGFKRAKDFSWEQCAKETLAVIESFDKKQRS